MDIIAIRAELRAVSRDNRDRVIRLAYAAGVSKRHIWLISGIARSTIDAVLKKAETASD